MRHPLRTVATLVKVFCKGVDTPAAALASVQLDTIEALLPAPSAPPWEDGGERDEGRPGGAAGECARRFGWFWVQYNRLLLPHVDGWYRVENTSACQVLAAARILGGAAAPNGGEADGDGDGDAAAPSLVPAAVAARAAEQCAAAAAAAATAAAGGEAAGGGGDGAERAHGHINARNVGSGRVVVEMASLQRLDAPLAEAMSELARELGYGQLISSA